jgi:cardiolipin synthase
MVRDRMKSRRTFPLAALSVLLTVACAHPTAPYVVPEVTIGEPSFARAVEAHTLSPLVTGNRVRLLLNGDEIFPAMLAAIRAARTSITFSNYLWQDGPITNELADAVAERCRAGVGASVLIDAVGSHGMPHRPRERMERAGCHVADFHPVNVLDVRRVNHRNHRRVLVVDGRLAFAGGTGIGSQWTGDGRQRGHWRQTDVVAEGPIVRHVQAAFADTWRDATGILLGGDAYFPELTASGGMPAQGVRSAPRGGSSEAYALFLLAIEGARRSIRITTPYFVPDADVAAALIRAVRRGVRVEVLVAGEADNVVDRMVRKASQAEYGSALQGGIKIYEYGPALLHAKTMAIDGRWASVGSVNLDSRSLALNHELTLVVPDAGLARRLDEIFRDDLAYAREVTIESWKRRGVGRFLELFVLPLRNQL